MLIAHVADTHITARAGETGMTLAEQVDLLRWVGDDAADAGAELLIHGGDLFDALSTPTERLAAIDVVQWWAERFPLVFVRGNHDRALDLAYLDAIRSANPVYVCERQDVLEVAGARVACLPWPRKAGLVQALGSVDALEVQAVAGDAMRAVLRGLSVQLRQHQGPRILLAHAELGTALMDNGQPIAGRCDIELGEADLLEVGADYVALGHIHRHQVIQGRICYPGSPRPTTFPSDTGTPLPHGYCLVDVVAGADPVIEHRRTPYRELLTIEAIWCDGVGDTLGGLVTESDCAPAEERLPAICGSSVKLKYSVASAHRKVAAEQAEQAKAAWLDAGAHAVTIDARTVPTYRVRSEAIAAARTTEDRIRAYWAGRGQEPTEVGAQRLLAKLGELEAAA